MSIGFSKRVNRIVQSEIRAMSLECERLGGINLAQGVCDTEIPLPVRRAVQEAIDAGMNSYTRFDGLSELREVIAQKVGTDNGIRADPETDIVVSAGSTGSFYCACMALLDPGDEVVLFEPFYGYHVTTLLAVDAIPVYVRTHPPDWTFDPGELKKVISSRTKAIVINTPSNPSGKVFTRAELEYIADLAISQDLFVFTDEIYEHFVYDGLEHVSLASLPGMASRTITISGFSKALSITGWRIGYSISDARWARMIGFVNDLVYVCAPAPLQYAVAYGLRELDLNYFGQLCVEYQQKRDLICQSLAEIGMPPYTPQGAYYVLADASHLPGKKSKEKTMFFLRQTGVAGVPGEAFFHDGTGKNLIRFCFAKAEGELEEACRKIQSLRV